MLIVRTVNFIKEQDDFENGCLLENGHSGFYDVNITAKNQKELIKKLQYHT